ncbi:hypothetical protein [Salinimicrobium flavum]|uniref:Uncharacterized protein n=1 Tax=Salinimicrobium flavum TaxID=1737065 RepID=A0ABW5J0G9_9FLAO
MHLSVRRPIMGGFVFAVAMGISIFTFGEITGIQAKELLETSVSGIISLCYVVVIGTIYILVIILHLLSVPIPRVTKLRLRHYHLLLNIARFSTLLIISAVTVLLLLNIPFTRIRGVADSHYLKIYYVILGVASIIAGGFISVITMIYHTIRTIINQKVDGSKRRKRNRKIKMNQTSPSEENPV